MCRMFLGRVRASEGHSPVSEGGASPSDCRDRMFDIHART